MYIPIYGTWLQATSNTLSFYVHEQTSWSPEFFSVIQGLQKNALQICFVTIIISYTNAIIITATP